MSDSLTTAAGMVIDAQGHVTYDFAGHVHAQGLDLDAGANLAPPDDLRVRWLDATGAAVASLFASHGTHDFFSIYVGDPTAPGAQLLMDSHPSGVSLVRVVAGAQSRLLIDSNGNSDFL